MAFPSDLSDMLPLNAGQVVERTLPHGGFVLKVIFSRDQFGSYGLALFHQEENPSISLHNVVGLDAKTLEFAWRWYRDELLNLESPS